ncbi:MAG: 1-deoxy-D-xylulose-5-phosphate reductoisomerase [Ignavibacteria bacterium]|nr:1-deoxy-D-xylulose-5-phosphate reductoisomerase [Ignavibacteria bacterium]
MHSLPRNITVLGSTGSIGTQTLNIVQRFAPEYQLRWLTCNTKVEDLAEQASALHPYGVAIRDEGACKRFKNLLPDFNGRVLCGEAGLCEAASDTENDFVMSAMVGFSGVAPTMAAVESGHTIGLANKETMVSAGKVFTEAARKFDATLIAVDSEHSAILQCLIGENPNAIARFIITASGGPFRSHTSEQLQHVRASDALAHPNWKMGDKITVDSSTLMNKGFEVIEAHWLFGIDTSRIDVVIHPQSIIHSLVEFVDGSIKAQLSLPSMLLPIQYALTYPHRLPLAMPPLDLAAVGALTFEKPDTVRFPCLRLAYEALETGGSAGCVLNAANEVAVQAFLSNQIAFIEIPRIVEEALNNIEHLSHPSMSDILAIDRETRNRLLWNSSVQHSHS